MSQLSDVSLRSAMLRGHLSITPWTDRLAQPASIEVTLGTSWLLPDDKQHAVDLVKRNTKFRPVNRDRVTLYPGAFALATTAETITLDGTIAAKFEGKSSLGRMGAMTHVTAGFIDPGFSGQITLEVYNVSPWALTFHAGMAIGQLVFTWLDQPCSEPYGADRWGSHYHGQTGATGAIA